MKLRNWTALLLALCVLICTFTTSLAEQMETTLDIISEDNSIDSPIIDHMDAQYGAKSDFMYMVADLAVKDYPNSRILPSIVTAQAILETGWGQSEIMMRCNALFGVKATASWTGGYYSASTGEYYGTWTTTTALFRAYDSLEACLADHTDVLRQSRYEGVIGGTDYKAVCEKLQSGGYATDPEYAQKLIATIEANQLYEYDYQVISRSSGWNTPSQGHYNASAAIEYARRWTDNSGGSSTASYNPQYKAYAGNDCSNFVSQCLVAGGFVTDNEWAPYNSCWNTTWLRSYLTNGYGGMATGLGYKSIRNASISEMSPGDLLFMDWDFDDACEHVVIISEVANGVVYVCGHTSNLKDSNYNKNISAYRSYLIKMNGSVLPERHFYCRQLQYGDKGTDVRELQELLISRGYNLGSWGADGDYGNATVEAVKAFQRDNGLEVDGVCGDLTANALLNPPECDEYYNIISSDGFLNMRSTPNGSGINGQAYASENPLHITRKQNDANGNPWGWTTSASCPGGGWVALFSPFAERVYPDSEAPTVSNIQITDVSPDGYTVSCTVTDNVGVVRVAFPTIANGETDFLWRDGSLSGNTASFRVNTSDHGGRRGNYRTEIYAYDARGNNNPYSESTTVSVDVPFQPGKPTVSVSAGDELHEITFSWSAASDTDWYDVYIWNMSGDILWSKSHYYRLNTDALLAEGSYQVSIAAVNGNGRYTFSDRVGFSVSGASAGEIGALKGQTVYEGHLYQLYDNKVTWLQAKRLAEQCGGHLVTITSQGEQDAVYALSRYLPARKWIGAESFTNQTMTWITGEAMTYGNWVEGEPNNDGTIEYCAHLYEDGRWNDVSNGQLEDMNGYIVEYDSAELFGQEMTGGYERILPDGDYMIASAANPAYFLDIVGGQTPAEHGTNVTLYSPINDDTPDCDAWTIRYADGFYRISQKGYDRSLDVRNANMARGGNVVVAVNNDFSAQKWAISLNDGGGYRLQAKCSGLSLDITGGKLENGVNVEQWTAHNEAAQQWVFIPYKPEQTLPDGRYILLSALDETMELDVAGNTGDVDNGVNVQIWKDTALSQYNSFDVRAKPNGYYTLTHAASGKALTAWMGGTNSGSNIALNENDGSMANEWAITRDGDNGGYVLRVRSSGYALDVENAVVASGTNVQQYHYNGTKAQTWRFVPAEYAVTYDANDGSGAPDGQVKYYKNDLTLSSQLPVREGYEFVGWATTLDANTAEYQPGDIYSTDAALSLYAVWKAQIRLVLPKALTEIGEEAFVNCGASVIVIPDGCEEIGPRAFADCANLTDITIPASVLTISRTAFSGCSGAMTIHGEANSVAASFAKACGFRFVELPN